MYGNERARIANSNFSMTYPPVRVLLSLGVVKNPDSFSVDIRGIEKTSKQKGYKSTG